MKKRLTCLFLCLVMLLSVFLASCAEETDEEVQDKIEEMAAKNTVSLTMWVVSDEPVSEEADALVTKELSTLTEAKFKAKLDIKYFTKDEYYEALKENMEAYSKYLIENDVVLEEDKEVETDEEGNPIVEDTEAELVTDADGMLKDKYPDYLPNQVDIIYVGDLTEKSGEALFNELVSEGALAALDSELSTGSKKLREYLSPTLLSAVQKNGVTYAIPNNNVIGEYTYMLLNKELTDVLFSAYVSGGKIDNLFNQYVYSFLDQLKTSTDSSVLPIDATYEECLNYLAHYWSIDPDSYAVNGTDFSVFGTLYEDLAALSRGSVSFDVDSLFANPDFVSDYLKLNSYRFNEEGRDFFRSEKNADTVYDKVAIKFESGDLTMVKEVVDTKTGDSVLYYDDADGTRYYALPIKYPSATSEDIYGNMFAVYHKSVDVARCMEVITYINTNVEARNILQYGVLDTHYELKEREVADLEAGEKSYFVEQKIGKNGKKLYSMDLYATGNTFLAYLTPDMNENIWESGKKQNRSSLVYPLLGFELADYAASAGKIGNSISLPDLSGAAGEKLSYTMSYSSGYDKTVLSQNKSLAEWIAACDKAEKGVFVLKTYVENKNSQKMDGIFYVYNTLGEAEFSVVATPSTEPVYDKDGNIKMDGDKQVLNEIGMDLGMTYTNAKSTGYTLSVIEYTGTCNSTYQNTVSATVNGNAVDSAKISEKLQDYVTEFDFLSTAHYDVDIYGDLYASHFAENAFIAETLTEWIDAGEAHNVMQWKKDAGDKDVYTFMIFRGGLAAATELDVQVRGGEKEIVLNLNYTSIGNGDDGAPLAEMKDLLVNGKTSTSAYKNDPYLLYYVVATVDKDVTISLNSTADILEDQKDREALAFELLLNEDIATVMDVYGELNTELVAYMETLSAKVEAILDACTTYEELEAVVTDLGILLAGADKAPDASKLKTEAVKDLAEEYTVNGKLEAFNEQIVHITNYKTLAELANSATTEDEEGEDSAKTELKSGEKKYYYLSPYGIYYQWMQEFSYLPADFGK